ncbi:ABC transporter permease [Sneathiella aquimaris]|uniref:ABC transporter permease n=1 Tax=Sneathiella aquimaris TaxID=2599305 RepID=UPI00146D5FCB|nr:ABC transporter permease [Sneathiella aquimaris]
MEKSVQAVMKPRSAIFARFHVIMGRNVLFLAGSVTFLVILVAAVFAPVIATHDPSHINFADKLVAPGMAHWFGTDELGRDLFSRILYGARVSLLVGIVVTGLAVLIGVPVGLAAGYLGGRAGYLIMRVSDVFIAFPPLLLPIAITAALGQGLFEAMIALAISWFPWYARIVEAAVLSIRQENYVRSARAFGFSHLRIMVKHILPNCWTPVIVQASMDFGYTILAAASLSFIGIGAKPPMIEWGLMVAMSRGKFLDYWWTAGIPGLAIVLTVLSVNLIGDGVRDLLDPKENKQ